MARIFAMAVGAMAELVEVEVVQLTMFQGLVQDKATVAEADKLSTKAALHQTATVMHDLAATVEPTQVVVVAAVGRIMAAVDLESLS